MGAMKWVLRSAPKSLHRNVEQLYDAAFFRPAPFYRRVALCGWRFFFDKSFFRLAPELGTNRIIAAGEVLDIEIQETDSGVSIKLGLANIKEESLHLAISGKRLIIRGETIRPETGKFPGSGSARMTPCFQRQIQLPENIDAGGFRAQLKGGIVRIDFCKHGWSCGCSR